MNHAVDTNVLIVANGRDTHADVTCRLAAVEALEEVREAGSLILDQGGDVLAEYATHCNFVGQPGLGDEFFRWAFQNQAVLTTIELTEHVERVYAEFPEAPDLVAFDPSDRKFVALVCSHGDAAVVNALDNDYREVAGALTEAGVVVRELCPHQLAVPD